MSKPDYWQEAKDYLANKDQILARLINDYPDEVLTTIRKPFQTLIRAVVGQQISVQSADAVWLRLTNKLPQINAHCFLALTNEQLKECGLSRQKIAYMTNIANAFEQGDLTPDLWNEMDDREIFKQLVKIKGVGEWTAQMFLIFHLNCPDIFPIADIGLVNAVKKLYGDTTKEQILDRSQMWQPYRTVASWYLWLSLDPVTVQY